MDEGIERLRSMSGVSVRSSAGHSTGASRAGHLEDREREGQLNRQSQVLQLVVFVIEGHRYALHLSVVERVLPMIAVSPLPKAPAVALGVINVHGIVIPVVDVRLRFGFPPRDYGVTCQLLVARTKRRPLVLPVDEVLGVSELAQETVISPDAVLPRTGHVAGIVALPDGILFIHDLDGFLALDEEERLTAAIERMAG